MPEKSAPATMHEAVWDWRLTWPHIHELFLAFATLYPNLQFLLFFIIPVKAKWLAWLDAAPGRSAEWSPPSDAWGRRRCPPGSRQ